MSDTTEDLSKMWIEPVNEAPIRSHVAPHPIITGPKLVPRTQYYFRLIRGGRARKCAAPGQTAMTEEYMAEE